MDCDLQHPPETVVEMYRLWEQGYEVVEGVKHSRGKESLAHKASAGMFYKLISKAVGIDMSLSLIHIYSVSEGEHRRRGKLASDSGNNRRK